MTAQIPRSLMIFAAGFGTRMGVLTQDRPKPLIPVAGRPLIDHALALAEPVVPGTIVVNLHYRAAQMQAHLVGRRVTTVTEDPILETGGGLKNALPLLGRGPVWTMNSDAVWQGPNPLALVRDAWRDGMEALLLGIPPDRAIGHAGTGDFAVAPDGRVARGAGLVYSGVQILRTEGLARIDDPAFSLNLLWNRMLERGTLHVVPYPGQWCDVGHPEGIALAERMLGADV